MANPTLYVDAPARSPRRGGIREVAEFVTNSRIGMGAVPEFTSTGCAFPVDDVVLCYPIPTGDQNEKNPEGIDTIDAAVDPFGLYAGVQCWLDNANDFEADSRLLLEQGEDRGIEEKLNTWLETLAATTAATFTEAIAVAEEEADGAYLGAPVLVLNRGDTVRALAEGAVRLVDNGILMTANGTRILASSEITAGSVSAVGAITVLHTDIETHIAPTVTSNLELAISERVYSIIVDCKYAVRIEVS